MCSSKCINNFSSIQKNSKPPPPPTTNLQTPMIVRLEIGRRGCTYYLGCTVSSKCKKGNIRMISIRFNGSFIFLLLVYFNMLSVGLYTLP